VVGWGCAGGGLGLCWWLAVVKLASKGCLKMAGSGSSCRGSSYAEQMWGVGGKEDKELACLLALSCIMVDQ